jgi:hypothetical protein
MTFHYALFSKYLNSPLIASRQRKRNKEGAKYGRNTFNST